MPPGEQGEKPRRQWAPDARALSVVGDRWVMVIVRDLASGPLRLESLRRWLPGVSAGALDSRLTRMAEAGLITRRRRRSLPPRVDLELTERGHALLDAIGELARWELRTQWSRPRDDEWIDVGACFRLAPFLPCAAATLDGRLALTIADGADGAPEHYTFVREHGRAHIERRDTPSPEARMSGTEAAWVKALSPEDPPPASSSAATPPWRRSSSTCSRSERGKRSGGQRVPHTLAAGAKEPPRLYWRLAARPVGCASLAEVPG